jgi:hypothetical protein
MVQMVFWALTLLPFRGAVVVEILYLAAVVVAVRVLQV